MRADQLCTGSAGGFAAGGFLQKPQDRRRSGEDRGCGLSGFCAILEFRFDGGTRTPLHICAARQRTSQGKRKEKEEGLPK
jgi:hypothetical protein